MTEQPEAPIDRIPVAHSVVYAVRGVPEVADEYNAERTIAPHEISLTYRASTDEQLGRVHAYVKGWWMEDGKRVPMDKPVGRHFWGRDFDGWPAWLAAEARLHDPNTVAERIRVDALKAAGVEYEDCPTCRAARPVGEDCGNCAFQARMDAELKARGLR